MTGKNKVLVFQTPGELAEFAVGKWSELALSAVEGKGVFNAVLSGGKTPAPFYRRLAERGKNLPWEATHIFWADERFVPPGDQLSNYRLVKETLLDCVPLPEANIHPVDTSLSSPRASAAGYREEIHSHFNLRPKEFPAFDLIVLGLGRDGHTASLFPGRPALLEEEKPAVAELSPPVPPPRVSLTLPVLNRAACLLFLVSGVEKAPVLQRVVEEGDRSLPAARVEPREGELIFAVDRAAASLLS